MWIIIIMLLLMIVLYLVVNNFFNKVVNRRTYSVDKLYKSQIDRGLIDKESYEALNKEEIELISKEGLSLKGIYIEAPRKTNKTVILVHGISVSHVNSIKYMNMFYRRGWNILTFDHRRHGNSEGKYSTYGYYEKEDLDLWVNWVVRRNGNNSVIGLHGESMGAATVLQYASISKYVSFIIADCGYSNLKELLKYRLKEDTHWLLMPMYYMASFKALVKAKFKFGDVRPIDDIKNSPIPTLFIHGSEDTFVPYYMSEKMYEAKKNNKKIYIAKGAAHAASIEVDREAYEKVVNEFLDEVLLGKEEINE